MSQNFLIGSLVKCNTYKTKTLKIIKKVQGRFFINSREYLLNNSKVVEGCKQQQVKYNN